MLSFGQPVFALSSIRQMRGHTHAQLLSASDGYAYVTKYTSNPLGRRVLITEWIGAQLLRCVGLPAPLTVAVGTGRMSRGVPEGLHVGSRYPGDPSTTAVYDFLPDQLCKHVSDWRCLAAGVVTFDIWLANSDARQTIFARSAGELRPYFIDNTHLFGGPDWSFATTPATGKLMPPSKLSGGLEWPDFCPWIARIQRLGDALLRIRDCAFGEWLTPQSQHDLDCALSEVQQRTHNLHEIVDTYLRVHMSTAHTNGVMLQPAPSCGG